MSATKLDYALAYAEVLPGKLLPVVQMGKKPVIGAWQKDASNDPVMLNQWFRGKANIGWMPNHEYFVLDVDMKLDKHGRNGFGTLAQWESKHGPLPTTLSATTPTGGKHLIFRLPPGKVGKTFSGSVLKSPAHGIDIRASGTGQVVIEPSERHEGRYSWDNWRPLEGPPPEIAEAPSWLVAFATGEDRGSVKDDKGVPKGAGRAMLVTEGGRNSALVSEAGRLRRVGYEFEAMVAALRALNKSQFSPPLPESEVVTVAKWACESHEPTEGATLAEQQSGGDYQAEIEEADGAEEMLDIVRRLQLDTGLLRTESLTLTKAAAKRLGVPIKTLMADLKDGDTSDDARPVIHVRRHDFAGSVDSCLQVLPAIPCLRQRSGELVKIESDAVESKVVAVQLPQLAYLTAQSARWNYGDAGDGSPDPSTLQAVLGAGSWPGVPEIVGLLTQPTIDLQSGAIISGRGYVPSLRREAVFDPSNFPNYAGSDAVGLLRGLLKGFAFATARDEAAALAAILTAAVRPVLPTAPAFLISACDYGSGKTYLSRLVSAFAGGSSVQRWPGREEDQSKVLLSLLLEGRPSVLFDNLSRDWRSDTLAAILTDPVFSDRQLGASKSPVLSTCCLWIANGVNIAPAADLQRRVITILLDPHCEKPWERSFDRDPLAEVEADRGKWMMIALRIMSDFLTSGESPKLASLGSFTDWSRIVRSTVVAAGLPDPVEALGANVADDGERDILARVLWFWFKAFPGEPMTGRDLIRAVGSATGESNEAGLRYALEEVAEERGEINLRRLGYWLRSHRGRIVDRLRIVSADGRGEFGVAWYVQQVGSPH